MDKGDFFVHFMDLTEEELKKPVDDIVPPRLEALLELALRMSTANTDPFKDDLKVGGNPTSVTKSNKLESKLLQSIIRPIYLRVDVLISYPQLSSWSVCRRFQPLSTRFG